MLAFGPNDVSVFDQLMADDADLADDCECDQQIDLAADRFDAKPTRRGEQTELAVWVGTLRPSVFIIKPFFQPSKTGNMVALTQTQNLVTCGLLRARESKLRFAR